nr:NapC/NirT family cytochrome c [uncultured Draconibacterium sp.]
MNDKTKSAGKRSKLRMPRVLLLAAVIVVVLSGLVTGGVHWHNQPGFCTNCHTPMNEYVENYYGGDTTLMITSHAMADTVSLRCLDCHSQKLNEQLTEGAHWLTGNYTFPLEKREIGTRSFCMTAGCHIEEDIIKATTDTHGLSFAFSQHDPRHGKQECYTCHSMHGQSVYSCNQCHHFELPEGWISPQPNGVIASLD